MLDSNGEVMQKLVDLADASILRCKVKCVNFLRSQKGGACLRRETRRYEAHGSHIVQEGPKLLGIGSRRLLDERSLPAPVGHGCSKALMGDVMQRQAAQGLFNRGGVAGAVCCSQSIEEFLLIGRIHCGEVLDVQRCWSVARRR